MSGVGRDRFRTGSSFTSFVIGNTYLNIIAQPADKQWSWWGRLILHVLDTDSLYERAIHAGLTPEAPPREAGGERYFHLTSIGSDAIEQVPGDDMRRISTDAFSVSLSN